MKCRGVGFFLRCKKSLQTWGLEVTQVLSYSFGDQRSKLGQQGCIAPEFWGQPVSLPFSVSRGLPRSLALASSSNWKASRCFTLALTAHLPLIGSFVIISDSPEEPGILFPAPDRWLAHIFRLLILCKEMYSRFLELGCGHPWENILLTPLESGLDRWSSTRSHALPLLTHGASRGRRLCGHVHPCAGLSVLLCGVVRATVLSYCLALTVLLMTLYGH